MVTGFVKNRAPVEVMTVSSFASRSHEVLHFFGTRHGPSYGEPNADLGRVRAAEPDYPFVVSVHQVHGTDALILDGPVRVGEKFAGGWDVIITDQPGILVTVRTADCVPVLLHDPQRETVAVIHAGWRGAVNGIVEKTMSTMQQRFGCRLDDLRVAIGPSAGACCYEVDQQVMDPLRGGYPEWSSVVKMTDHDKWRLDLKKLIRGQALGCGVHESNIQCLDLCTICRPDVFFSYRREGQVSGKMVSGIMLTGKSPST